MGWGIPVPEYHIISYAINISIARRLIIICMISSMIVWYESVEESRSQTDEMDEDENENENENEMIWSDTLES